MGLDQNAGKWMSMEYNNLDNKGKPQTYECFGPYYWRKHARLQTFMQETYERKNQDAKPEKVYHFREVELDIEDIDRLDKAINNGFIEYFCEGGFFYGHQYQEESCNDYKKQDKEFVSFARKEIAKGTEIVYTCSW